MCSVEEGDIEELNSLSCSSSNLIAKAPLQSTCCRKCDQVSVILLQKKDPLCKECFLTYCHHKFRSTIGKTKKIKPGHKVLIAYSGGSCSSAMIHLVLQALNDASHKKMLFIPGVLHIDENTHSSSDKLSSCMSQIEAQMKVLNSPMLFSSINMAFRSHDDQFYFGSSQDLINSSVSRNLQSKLEASLSNTSSLSSKQDYLECLRMQLTADIAKHAGYTCVFSGNSATNLATKLLSSISLGRGSQISNNTNFCDERYGIPVFRPLREFLNKELVFYNHLSSIPFVVQRTLLTMTGVKTSIQRLTENFISGLQENFPATIFTIFRMGEKITGTSGRKSENERCWMCQSIRDNSDIGTCSALQALELSAKLSQPSSSEKNLTCIDDAHKDDILLLNQHLCHGCGIVLSEMKNSSSLTPELLNRVSKEASRERMKEEIEEFLLNDEAES